VFIVDAVVAADDSLVITEINFHPPDPVAAELQADASLVADDFEFVELANVANVPVLLQEVAFADGISFSFPLVELPVGQRVVVVRNEAAFRLRYGEEAIILGEYDGRLSNGGERLTLMGQGDSLIASFQYDDSELWPATADGVGASLELRNPGRSSNQEMDKYYRWRGSTEFGGSPGGSGDDPIGVVINEILSHTDPPLLDSIELFNPTDSTIDISGWFLSDAAGMLRKYEIPAGSVLAPNGYSVFDESQFNPTPGNPADNAFALSGANGDDVYLVIPGGNGGVSSFVDDVHFGPTSIGETLGRIPNGSGRLSPQGRNTMGCGNSQARVGPLIISEFNYNPGDPSATALLIDRNLVEDDLEFIEVHNPTGQNVTLTNWRVRGGVEYDFDASTMIAAGETLVVISFNPNGAGNAARLAAFRAQYGIDDSTKIVGGWSGQLSDSGEEVRLLRPDAPPPENPALIPRVTEDAVLYDDLPPWPVDADGQGSSLVRGVPTSFAGDAANWSADAATPGSVGFSVGELGDFTGDGLVSAADIDVLLDAVRRDSNVSSYDLDNNSVVNREDVVHLVETILGTHAGDANLDGIVDAADLNQVGLHWQQQTCHGWADGDFTGDGAVTALDLNELGINWQRNVVAPAEANRIPRAPLGMRTSTIVDFAVEELTREMTPVEQAADVVDSSDDHHVQRLLTSQSRHTIRWREIEHRRTINYDRGSLHEIRNKAIDDIFVWLTGNLRTRVSED
jgi:hypothetical protein